MQEARRIDVGQQRDLPIELVLLLAKQIGQRRIFDALDRNQVELPLEQRGIDRQRPVVKHGRLLEPRAAKFAPGALGVHRRRLQQQIERAVDFGQLAVDIQHGFDDRAAAGRMEVGRPQRFSLPDEGESGLLQRVVQRAACRNA